MAFTDAEKETMLEILGLTGATGTTERATFDAAIAAAEAITGRDTRIRTYLAEWASIIAEPVKKSGGAQGIEYETVRHWYKVYKNLSQALGYAFLTFAEYQQQFSATGPTFGVLTIRVPDACATDDWCDL